MACPTCLKLGIPPSRFCDQTCFKGYWNEHKQLHNDVKKARNIVDPTALPTEFKNYRFTGPLRPCQKTAKRTVPDHIARPDYATHPMGVSFSEQDDKRSMAIKVYNSEEIAGIREACRIGREVLDIAGAAVKAGITCDELDRVVHEATVERNAYPSPLNYYQFPKSVCTSVNEVICHGIPDMRQLVEGDIVNLDISVYKDGYHADLNETFFVGQVDEKTYNLVKCAYDSLAAAIATVKPGAMYRDIGEEITKVTKAAKMSVVTTYCGHGIGRLFHTTPNVPHYAKNKAKGIMQPGHIFTIEPMINIGGYEDVLWPDNWTAVTRDGSRSAQFEHTMLVTESGVELLTARVGAPTDRIVWDKETFQR
jgi:methionyl aminopeptidase